MGDSVTSRPACFLRASALAALIVALGIAGCGRKGALDAPPSASAAGAEENTGVDRPGGATGLPVIRGAKKRIPLDALLD